MNGCLDKNNLSRPPLSKEETIKIIDFLTRRASKQAEYDSERYKSMTGIRDSEEMQLEISIEEAKRQDEIFFNTGVEPYEYEKALEFYYTQVPNLEVIQAFERFQEATI